MPSKKVCTKTLLPDLCGEVTLKSIVVMVVCKLNVLLEYVPYNYVVQQTPLKPVLWILFLICLFLLFFLPWQLSLWCFIPLQLQFHLHLVFAYFPLLPLPLPLFLLLLHLLSVSFHCHFRLQNPFITWNLLFLLQRISAF